MISLYTKKNCEKCQKIKSILRERKIQFVEKPIEIADNLAELINSGITLGDAPVMEKDGVYYTNSSGLLKAIPQ